MHEERTDRRDFTPTHASPPWPGNARLAVSFVVNVEEGAELSIADGDERNEPTYEIREEVPDGPDFCMETHFAYGPRRGYARIADAFDRFGVSATFSTCARAAERLPWLIRDAVARGHEISAHGWRWERHAGMDPAHEAQIIARTHATLERIAGVAPVGWHTRSAPSGQTRALLLDHGGFLYDSDAYDDDMPRLLPGHRHVIVPYAFDTNDMRFAPGGGFVQAEDFSRYCISAVDWLLREGRTAPRMLSIGLHLRIIGRPARMPGLEAVLAHVARTPGIWTARRRDIAAHWLSEEGR